MAIRHSITLSTSEPNNEVGNLKIRQGDEQTQTLVANITENGVPKPFVGLQPFFCAKLGQTAGLGIIEQKVTGTMNPANGTLEYVMQPEDWQQLGRQTAYFSFRKMVNDHEWTEQFSTRDFNYNVTKSVFSEGLREVKKDGSTYLWTIEDMLRLFKEYMTTGKVDWEKYKNDERTIWETYRLAEKINWDDYKLREKNEWKNYKDDEKTTWENFVEDNREFLENADPGGKIILELLGGRGGFDSLGERLDSEKAEVSAQLAHTERVVNVSAFGATGDGITDDTVAIKNAITYAKSIDNSTLLFPLGNYCVATTISIPNNINVEMTGTLVYTGVENIPLLVIGEAEKQIVDKRLTVRAVRKTVSTWLDENSMGIKIINAYTCDINIVRSEGFTIGVQFIGEGGGFSYNEVTLNFLYNNKIPVDLNSKTVNGKIGWCNENNYYGGRFANSSENPSLARYGVRLTTKDSPAVARCNNNVFYKPSFEIGSYTNVGVEALPILLEHARFNTFYNIRNENNSEVTARVLNASAYNNIGVGYGNVKIDDQSDNPSTVAMGMRDYLYNDVKNLVFSSGALAKKACIVDGVSSVNIPNLEFGTSQNANSNYSITAVTITPNYIELAGDRVIGVHVESNANKVFMVRRDTEPAPHGGRLIVRCYDDQGNVLDGLVKDYLRSSDNVSAAFVTTYGGAYEFASTTNELFFTLDPDVKHIFVGFRRHIENLRIRSFSIYARDNTSATWVGYDEIVSGVNIGISPPSAGTWERGRTILNRNKTELGTAGNKYVIDAWECIVAGTPGTWIEKRAFTGN